MGNDRKVLRAWKGIPTMEGAGVRLSRIFGYHEAETMDPFLLLDHFGSDNPDDYVAGFPWHPHRGIETVTYMIEGEVEHGDSLGNKGVIRSGDVQWMTAGSGIIHQEMPQPYGGTMRGFQLWVNLPAQEKMMPPRYRGIFQDQIPQSSFESMRVNVIAGELEGLKGPVQDLVVEASYADISVSPHSSYRFSVPHDHRVFAYIFEGEGYCDEGRSRLLDAGSLVLFDEGNGVRVSGGDMPVRLLLVSGAPLGEPIAWRGPIVMNTQEELDQAFREYRAGTFIKENTV